jgi:hypothetical protein
MAGWRRLQNILSGKLSLEILGQRNKLLRKPKSIRHGVNGQKIIAALTNLP